jgi:hypothetical protein
MTYCDEDFSSQVELSVNECITDLTEKSQVSWRALVNLKPACFQPHNTQWHHSSGHKPCGIELREPYTALAGCRISLHGERLQEVNTERSRCKIKRWL